MSAMRVGVMLRVGINIGVCPMAARATAVVSSLLLATTALAVLSTGSAYALTRRECTDKYIAAQTAGTARGMKLSDFRRSECGTAATGSNHRRAQVRNKG
jgi:nucleoside phosphorylase